MMFLRGLLIICIYLQVECKNLNVHPRIVNGEVVDPQDYPFFVRVYVKFGGKYFACGGTLVNPLVVITAAHCIKSNDIYLVNWKGEKQPAQRVIAHPEYHARTDPATGEKDARFSKNDIALIIISEPWKTETAVVLNEDKDVPSGMPVISIGYGITELGQDTDQLKMTETKTMSYNDCKSIEVYLDEGFFCTHNGYSGTCSGDSGGPLFMNKGDNIALVGITSFGHFDHSTNTCLVEEFPTAFTNVAYYFRWIKDTLKAAQ
ncbi:unnamed protein product [Acanthoscelides obtectus]|uniref:Peptidase S1 domain-containing protein n=2 Tax=Acanthoscelides obtectus TaxID=200917 RepID=A0A9P0KV24_ACAOB|nr:unnamed protein product [Acanthoscelides obtectus]CAK1638232.1 Kallikrein-2 [Acanthoscelides obtectus]